MEWINHFPFISYGKNSFGVRPVWYKSKDLEQIKDVYRCTTIFSFTNLLHKNTFSILKVKNGLGFEGSILWHIMLYISLKVNRNFRGKYHLLHAGLLLGLFFGSY
jgi:hypothetical protein